MKVSQFRLGTWAVCAAAAVVSSSLAPAAKANLLTYEGFDYPAAPNGLNSKSGGTGYGGTYSSNNNAAVVLGSFNYPDSAGRQLITAGNRAFMDSTTVGDPHAASPIS